MPKTQIVIYQESTGIVPLLEWLDSLPVKGKDKCIVKIESLQERGHELRRPHVDFLRHGIYELRIRYRDVQYRILYAFVGENIVLLSHGCFKNKRRLPNIEIMRALKNHESYIQNPEAHTYIEGL